MSNFKNRIQWDDDKRVPWQTHDFGSRTRRPNDVGSKLYITVPESVARLAYDEYAKQNGTQQSFERLHERGGFGVIELITLLAQRIERENS